MEKIGFESVEDLRSFAKQKGVKESRLEKAVRVYSLPKSGTFAKAGVVDGEFAHIFIETVEGDRISISGIQANAHIGSVDEAKFRKIMKEGSPLKGKLMLIGSIVNPKLTGDQAVVAKKLEGKSFEAEEIEAIVLPYDETGYSTETQAKKALTTKKLYRINLVD